MGERANPGPGAEPDPPRLRRDLDERMKELKALHATAALLQDDELPVEELLARVAALVPPAFLHSADAAARVVHGRTMRGSPGFAETPWMLRSPFRTGDGQEGRIEVAYLREHATEAEGPFLAEERVLLDTIAEMVRVSLDHGRIGRHLRSLVDTGTVRLFVLDLATQRLYFPGLREVAPGGDFGTLTRTREEAHESVHPEDRDATRRAVDEAVASTGGPGHFSVEYRVTLKGPRYEWRRLTGHVVRDEAGIPMRVIGISTDISEQRSLQERLRQAGKMEALGRLAGGVAHDFNNILVAILGYSQLAQARLREDDPVLRHLREIEKAGNTAAALVKQILAFSRRQELKPRVVDLRAVVADTGALLGTLVGRGVGIEHDFAAEAPQAMVDPAQVQQVILNLAVNARDAMPRGGTLTLRVKGTRCGAPQPDGRLGPPRLWCVLEAEDTGTGMPPEVRERIFEPFFTTKAEGKGTGLGLATVHGIVTQSGGFLEVESEVGRGTLFRVHFPVPAG
jgi:signal transduction histidine kinase